MICSNYFDIDATIVANEFIDKYMPESNGDYVKVYLFLLRNRERGTDVPMIAEKLRLTEGDVRRAIAYWEEKGIVSVSIRHRDSYSQPGFAQTGHAFTMEAEPDSAHASASADANSIASANAADNMDAGSGYASDNAMSDVTAPSQAADNAGIADNSTDLRDRYRRAEGKAVLNTLVRDDEFGKLLVIVQRYRSKILTESEQEVLAYLYDGLKLPCDVIDYLVEYCVSSGHNNMKYIEKTGLDWAEIGIRDVESARRRTDQFEMLKAVSSRRKKADNDNKGISRKTDLDEWVRAQVMETI